MIIRQRLYRRRFPRALGPLLPSFRTLVSAAEVAHLLALPSARMKGVPVRRVTLPRIPAPPEVTRGRRARHAAAPERPCHHPASGRQRPRRTPRHHRGCCRPTEDDRDERRPPARGSVSDAAGRERRGGDPPRPTASTGRCWSAARARARPARCSPSTSTTSRIADAAPIVIDPKSELSRICLRMTPPDCGKRVWFLDLGHPAFGMNPLRLIGDRPLAIEAAQIAENVVAALLDINENQIYQSSRRYLYHAVIGAIAIAHQEKRRAKLEDVYTLLRPAQGRLPSDRRRGVRDRARPRPDRRVLPLRAARRSADGHQPRRRADGRAAQQDLRADGRPAAATVLQPSHRHPAAGDHRGARHPDRRREHGRDRDREQQGVHAVHPADAARAAAAPGAPARARPPAGAAAGRRGALRRRRRERRRPDRHPPRRRPRARVRRCSTSRSSARAQSTSRRSSKACSTCCRAGSCSGWATPRTPRKPAGSRWPCTRR